MLSYASYQSNNVLKDVRIYQSDYIYCLIDRLYLFQRIVQNMSELNLMGQSFLMMPSIPNLTHTLLLIQTNKYFPVNSTVSLDKNVSQKWEDSVQDELSLDIKLNNHQETITSTSTIKKKKGGCTCKKTKCLKMYCQCFSSGKMCTEECSCYTCCNDHDHLESLQHARMTLKVKSSSVSKQAHGKGCNCKKSQCQKKYCECFNAGLPCGDSCKCSDCENGSCTHKQLREIS